MPIHDGVLRFGYPGDRGVGAMLESMVVAGTKTATCLPTGELTAPDAAETLGSAGRTIDIVDWEGRRRCRIVVTAAYEATFREPTAPLLIGEGYGTDAGAFQRDHVGPPGILDEPGARDGLTDVPAALSEVLVGHDGAGRPTTDLARDLDLPIEVVRQRLRRGRMRLAAVLAERAGLAASTANGLAASTANGPAPIASWASDEHLTLCEYCARLMADRAPGAAGPLQPDELDLAIAVVCFRLAD